MQILALNNVVSTHQLQGLHVNFTEKNVNFTEKSKYLTEESLNVTEKCKFYRKKGKINRKNVGKSVKFTENLCRMTKVNHYLTNKIPFLDVYGDINLVGHVIKSHKARRALWKI